MNLRTVGAWITAGAAFWVSLGALDVTADGEQVVRVAMLPGLAQLAACIALALAIGAALGARLSDAPRAIPGAAGAAPTRAGSGDSFVPLYALSVLILPYLPWLPDWLPVLRVFAGPGRLLVWLVVASQVAWSVLGTGRGRRVVVRMRAWSALGSFLVVFAVSAALFGAAALTMAPSGIFPGGDEPHYLVITQSLLGDHDLRIDNNHARQDYAAYYDADLAPHAIAPGRDGGTYSVHPVGLPLLAAPAFALGGYPGVVMLMILLAAAAAALAWRWVRRVTGSVAAATFSWSATALSVPYLTSSGTVYPEIPAAFAVMVAATVAIRDVGLGDGAAGAVTAAPARAWRALALGLATAALPWLHAKYALMAAVLLAIGVWRIWRDRPSSPWTRERLLAVAAVPFAFSIAAWLGFHYLIWGSPWPSAPYGGAARNADERAVARARRPGPARRPGVRHLLLRPGAGARARRAVVHVAGRRPRPRPRRRDRRWRWPRWSGTVGAFQMWWGGTALPGRMLISGLLLMTLPVGLGVPGGRRPARTPRGVPAAPAHRPGDVAGRGDRAQRRHARARPQRHLAVPRVAVAGLAPVGASPRTSSCSRPGSPSCSPASGCSPSPPARGPSGCSRPAGRRRAAVRRTGRGLAFLRADAGALLAVLLVTLVMPPVARRPPQAVPVAGRPRPASRCWSRSIRTRRPIGIRYDPLALADAASMPQAFARVGQAGIANGAPADTGAAQRALRAAVRAIRARTGAAHAARAARRASRATSSCRPDGPAVR
ncbi:MAG: hypothetical protein M0C28_16385 [Candidatus Moduliflexus flocculans]|nr:hypothetical protein [Candidatus Moduliflexus flocculans]